MKQAMIFAAGLGTRLKPITDTMPKALVPVGGEPLLQRVLLKLKDAGFERVVINVHHFAEQIVCFLRAKDMFGMDIHISYERDMLLETGGGIKKASSLFDASSPFLIHNVDILSNVDLADFYERAHDCDALLLVSERKTKRYLLFNDEMNLIGWTNIETGQVKSPFEDIKAMDIDALKRQYKLFAFSGIHVFSPSLFVFVSLDGTIPRTMWHYRFLLECIQSFQDKRVGERRPAIDGCRQDRHVARS